MSIENQIETILNNVPQVYAAGQNSVVDEFREELDGVKDDVETLIESDGLYGNSVKGYVSGEVIRVDDVSPIEHIVKVKVRGKNLIPYPNQETNTDSFGITFTDNGDGSVTANGTATDNTNYFYTWINSLIPIEAGTYTISGCPQGGSNSTYELAVGWRENLNSPRELHYEQGTGLTCEFKKGYLDVICVVRKGATVRDLVFKPQIELGDTATEYEPYIDPTTVTVIVDELAESYTPSSDGIVEIPSLSPTMTIITDTAGVNIDLEYNQDTNKAFDNVKEDITTLDNDMAVIKGNIGDVETALDNIIEIQNSLIGGDA